MDLFIFRRDLRIHDNKGFISAYKNAIVNERKLYPIFIFTPDQISDKNEYRSIPAIKFMIESLEDLANDIIITCFYGKPENILMLIENAYNKPLNVWVNADYTPYSERRDKSMVEKISGELHVEYGDPVISEPGSIKTLAGNQYRKFTPYYKSYIKTDIPEVQSTRVTKSNLSPIDHKALNPYIIDYNDIKIINKCDLVNPIIGGRKHGNKILKQIRQGKFNKYGKTRDDLTVSTTRLGAYLKFGCISPRETYVAVENIPDLAKQLIWRDFYYQIPDIMKFSEILKSSDKNIKWENDMEKFTSWCGGVTGYPIVDAAMTQLNKSGFMHNRGRLIVASFLIKNLQIDWRWGEKYFATKLIDYDPIVNIGNWLFMHGLTSWSQPYFRVYNPSLQSNKHDKNAVYIKKWIPELKNIPAKHLHDWEKYHIKYPDTDYPAPIVGYKESKEAAIKMYKEAMTHG